LLILGIVSFSAGIWIFYDDSIRNVDSNPTMHYLIRSDKILLINKINVNDNLSYTISFFLISIGLWLIGFISLKLFKEIKYKIYFKKNHIVLISFLCNLLISSIFLIGIMQNEISKSDDRLNEALGIIQPPFILTPFENTLDVFDSGEGVWGDFYFLYKTSENEIYFTERNFFGDYDFVGLVKNYKVERKKFNNEEIETLSFFWFWKNNIVKDESGVCKVIIYKNYSKSIFTIEFINNEQSNSRLIKGNIYGFRNKPLKAISKN
jgi:hypothetical protein